MHQSDDIWNILCSAHLRLDSSGVIVHVGPKLAKLQAGTPFCGLGFQIVFKLLVQHVDLSGIDLLERPRTKLSLRLLAGPKLSLKGVLVKMACFAMSKWKQPWVRIGQRMHWARSRSPLTACSVICTVWLITV